MQGQHDTDEQGLVEDVRSGSRTAFGRLVEPHLPRLLGLARRMLGSSEEAEDAVQTALASTWVARAKLDPAQPVAAYLTTVTLNKCRDRLRRRKAARFLSFGLFDMDLPVAAGTPDAETEIGDRQTLESVSRAIERLPVKLREALVLVTIDGRSQREAAELLGVTEKTIETRIYRARQRLREKLDFV
ncbi:RNA polymerase sigma factor [Stakelama pacifica]|uniref:RNA polymerase sigma-70 factor (ECF subfamily) n=1 Tax=Stakelama pacifica TaxID=517720 RepID=A0A4R6FBM0_9SPHN|nr:RNA polymerase sigma factor [Stakelama pacifica]TDN78437.1 RNA polymerase sigma-70 factor (ECF subfamily) [Stakelama pacifica]GGO99615.1 RNA polymerase subunit sigma-24 [Stakelama pacifica]